MEEENVDDLENSNINVGKTDKEKTNVAHEDIEGDKEGEKNEEAEGEHEELAESNIKGEELGGEEQIGEEQTGEGPICEEREGEELTDEEQIGEEGIGEELEGEQVQEEQEGKKEEQKVVEEEKVEEEEEAYVEEPPPDPAAPYDLSDSKEVLKPPFELRPDQLAEVEQLWELYQNYTPAYTDIDGYVTEKELVYMLKALLLMTYTTAQMRELIAYCVRPPHPLGHISYDQFLKMVILRQRDFPIEDELRSALQVLDPSKSGSIDREYMKELLSQQGHKMPQKQLNNLMKEVDISNDGTIGIEDVVGTMCIDLNREDIIMLMASLNPPEELPAEEEV